MPILKVKTTTGWKEIAGAAPSDDKNSSIYVQEEEPVGADDGTLWVDLDEELSDPSSLNAVLYTEQFLTEEQKAQARENIGAAMQEIPREKAQIVYNFKPNAVVNNQDNFDLYESVELACRYTDIMPVQEGDRFSYKGGTVANSYPSVIWFDKNKNIISTESYGALAHGCRLVTVPVGAFFVKFCESFYGNAKSYEEIPPSLKLQFEVLHINSENEEKIITIEEQAGGYFNQTTTQIFYREDICGKRTCPIPVDKQDVFYFTTMSGEQSYIKWYNNSGERIRTDYGDGTRMTINPPDDAVMVRFFAYNYSSNLDACVLAVSYKKDDKTLEYLQGMNYLWGKKYVACGDSFTAGDFSIKNEDTWDATYQTYKTYCWHIANRNQMTLINEAKSGSTMYNNGDPNAFSLERYKKIPTDADYITLCFGLNDQTQEGPMGDLNDTSNETVIGAWNVVLEYLITNIPYAKIGIIIADAYLNSTMRDGIISVAKYWGIPWLDLKGDPKVPMLIGGKFSETSISPKAVQLRNNAFAISETDSHPNPKGHEYRSTIIENFMRSL